jgi:hypothetical protein
MKYTVKFEENFFENFNKVIEHYDKISNELADRF